MKEINPYTNPIDRAVFRMRGVVLALVYLAGPVFLLSYGWMLKQLWYAAPGWLTAIVVASHLIGWLGIGILLDKRQEQDRL